jgi:AcrR family transcriptional regulator
MLDAAAHLFGSHRFHEVRMDDVAAEAEVSKGTLYRYFRDKEEMYLALLERSSRQMMTQLQQAVEEVEGARTRLTAAVAAIVEFFDARPHLLDLIQRAEVMRGAGPNFPWQRVRDEAVRLVLDIFEEGRRLGEFKVRDPQLAALLLLGGLRAIIRFGPQPRPPELARRIVDNFFHVADGLPASCN